jgi:hypothetical protein
MCVPIVNVVAHNFCFCVGVGSMCVSIVKVVAHCFCVGFRVVVFAGGSFGLLKI